MKPTIYAIAALGIVLIFMWSLAALTLTQPASAPRPNVPLTQELYDSLTPGMTVEEVIAIVGAEPIQTESVTSRGGVCSTRCYWANAENDNFYLRFIDGKLQDKIAANLRLHGPAGH